MIVLEQSDWMQEDKSVALLGDRDIVPHFFALVQTPPNIKSFVFFLFLISRESLPSSPPSPPHPKDGRLCRTLNNPSLALSPLVFLCPLYTLHGSARMGAILLVLAYICVCVCYVLHVT